MLIGEIRLLSWLLGDDDPLVRGRWRGLEVVVVGGGDGNGRPSIKSIWSRVDA